MSVPKDKYNRIYILYVLHAIALFLPWGSMLQVFAYFKQIDVLGTKSDADFWQFSYGISSLGPRMIFMVINMFIPKRVSHLWARILFSLGFQTLIMAFIILFTMALMEERMEEKPKSFFLWLSVVSNVLMSVAGGIYGSSLFGSVAVMPMKYTNALCLGAAITHTMIVISNIIFEVMRPTVKVVAFIYFSSSIAIQIVCIIYEITQESNKFRDYYENQSRNVETNTKGNRYLYVLKQISQQLLDLFLLLLVSFSIYEEIFRSIDFSDKVGKEWFTKDLGVLFSLLIYEFFNFVGTITANLFHYPTPKSMIAFSSVRLLLIPIFLLFNYNPKDQRNLPVLFNSVLLYCSFNVILALTNGHFWSLTVMYAPKEVPPNLASIAGMMSGAMICVPIMFSVYFINVLPIFV